MLTLSLAAQSATSDDSAIRSLIENSYFNGAFNQLDTTAMEQGFHPEFAILIADGESVKRFTIQQWIDSIKARKTAADFDPTTAQRECRVLSIDVTGSAAAAKVEVDRDGKRLYTDYLSLLKFPSGWRVVSKIYVEHS